MNGYSNSYSHTSTAASSSSHYQRSPQSHYPNQQDAFYHQSSHGYSHAPSAVVYSRHHDAAALVDPRDAHIPPLQTHAHHHHSYPENHLPTPPSEEHVCVLHYLILVHSLPNSRSSNAREAPPMPRNPGAVGPLRLRTLGQLRGPRKSYMKTPDASF